MTKLCKICFIPRNFIENALKLICRDGATSLKEENNDKQSTFFGDNLVSLGENFPMMLELPKSTSIEQKTSLEPQRETRKPLLRSEESRFWDVITHFAAFLSAHFSRPLEKCNSSRSTRFDISAPFLHWSKKKRKLTTFSTKF